MLIAALLAFLMSIIIFGLPSKRNFDVLEGKHLTWHSKWFRASILFHGLLAVLVLLLLFKLQMVISFGGQELSFTKHAWIYGIFAGVFYPGVLYSLIGGLSAAGISRNKDQAVKSSMDFYVAAIGGFVAADIYELSKKTAEQTRKEFDELEDFEIQDFLRALFLRIDSEDAGTAAEIIAELKATSEAMGSTEEEAIVEIRDSAIERILSMYLLKHGKRRYQIDIDAVKETMKSRQGED